MRYPARFVDGAISSVESHCKKPTPNDLISLEHTTFSLPYQKRYFYFFARSRFTGGSIDVERGCVHTAL